MAGKKILCGFFLVGILLTFSSAKKSSIAIAYQPEDLRAIVIEVIRSELAALNSSTSIPPNALALKLQEMKSSVEEIKEALMLSSFVMEHKVGETVEECGAMRTSLIGNHRKTGLALNGSSIRDTLSAMSSDIAVIKSKLANSLDNFPGTTATPTTIPGRTYSTTPFSRMTTTHRPDTHQYVSLTHFDELVRKKQTPLTGQTFNGSTVSDIMSSVSRVGDGGNGVVVVLINHLDRTINNFKMYDTTDSSLHAAPSSIAPHTKEVFTFAEPDCCVVQTAFSYDIPGNRAGISSFIDFHYPQSCGLAFVENSESIEQYLINRTEFPGLFRKESLETEQFAIRYQNLYAKMSADIEYDTRKATFVIEIVEESNARNSWDETTATSKQYETTERHAIGGSTYSTTSYPYWGTTNVTSRPDTAQPVSLTYFDDLVRRQPTPLTGKTFNGSTVSHIMSRLPKVGVDGKEIVVVFINHLNRTINNFKMYDPKNSSLHAAPSSIAPHTKEVFTFAEPVCCMVKTAFSYDIPGNKVGISTFMDMDFHHLEWCGLAFVKNNESMEKYITTWTGFPGSSRVESLATKHITIRYQNLYATMFVKTNGFRKATFVIEIVEESSARDSWDEVSGTTVYFDELVSRKPSPLQGKTFNGSTVSDFMSRVSRVGYGGRGVVVVLINHLDRTINNFKMYDDSNFSLHPAPSSIAPHTKEVFTFAERCCGYVGTAFSYNIPGINARVASVLDFTGSDSLGLAFVPTNESMYNYFNTHTGYPGSSRRNTVQTQQLVVGYQNVYAKMSVNVTSSRRKPTVVIEIVEELDDTTTEPPASSTPEDDFLEGLEN